MLLGTMRPGSGWFIRVDSGQIDLLTRFENPMRDEKDYGEDEETAYQTTVMWNSTKATAQAMTHVRLMQSDMKTAAPFIHW